MFLGFSATESNSINNDISNLNPFVSYALYLFVASY